MTRIKVESPGSSAEDFLLHPGETLLLGREPNPERLNEAVPTGALTLGKLEPPNVSANHVLVWQNGDESVHLRDARSRNGSWLRLPVSGNVSISTPETIQLHLAALQPVTNDEQGPPDVSWKEPAQFPQVVARAIEDWLRRRQIAVRVAVVRGRRTIREQPGRISLAKDVELHVEADDTLGTEWGAALGVIFRYVDRQRALLEAETEANADGRLTVASPAMRQALRRVIDTAKGRARCILITGPTGSGKEGLARSFHRHSNRSGALVIRNCAMLSKELVRSELFGAEVGAFTGCVRRIVGAVERAQGGTLFLDEMGELPLDVQAMLLRFLDDGEFEHMGEYGQTRQADVVVVCATNRDLRAACQERAFRSDLWYRLSAHAVEVPALRRRPEDIAAFLRAQHLAGEVTAWSALAPSAAELVLAHAWEGNFRELKSFAARLPFAAGLESIDAEACRALLADVALVPNGQSRSAVPPSAGVDAPELERDRWTELCVRALDAFTEDTRCPGPRTWDDFKEYIEKYLKPLALVHLGGLSSSGRGSGDVQAIAQRIDADRGTVLKQLKRYFERYGASGES